MANQKKYNHPEAPENISIKEEIQKMVSDFRAWLKKAKAKLNTKPTYKNQPGKTHDFSRGMKGVK